MTLDLDIQLRRGAFRLTAQMSAPPGVTVVFGPSGCGKTSLLQCVAGLIRPTHGTIHMNGSVWCDAPVHTPPHRRNIGFVFQDGRLLPHMSVRKNIELPLKFRPGGQKSAVDDWVDIFALGALMDRAPHTLSGGERQRAALARALVGRPDLLCLDEPLSAVDIRKKNDVLPYLETAMAHAQIPVLYVTHGLGELTRLADHVALMDQGAIVASGPVQDVMIHPKSLSHLPGRLLGSILTCTVEDKRDGVTRVRFPGGVLHLSHLDHPPGHRLRLRIAAQDVILATQAPTGLSALNVLSGQVVRLDHLDGNCVVSVGIGASTVMSRITEHSAKRLALAPGQQIHAIVKATAVDTVA
ncbi:MAG: molybdenum ABC transporter ATP-binding protein [Pseudomonadota bacterium]